MPLPLTCLTIPLVVAAFALASPAAAAQRLHFSSGGPHPASFDIAEQSRPNAFAIGTSFTLTGVAGIFDGVAGARTIDFFNNSAGGGFQVSGGPGIFSQQVYIRSESAPFVESGDYFATDRATGASAGLIVFPNGTVGGVPEPQSWALLVVGFGVVGAGLRRRAAVSRLGATS